MLGPGQLASADYKVALKPTVGYEQQLFISLQQSLDLGEFEVKAVNSGTLTKSVSANLALADAPAELLAVLDEGVDAGNADVVLTVTGTDEADEALTGTATIAAPAYAQMQDRVFPRNWAVDVVPGTVGKKFKTVTSATIVAGAKVVGSRIRLTAIPSIDTFVQVACRTRLGYDMKVPTPVNIQCGRNLSAYTKSGEIPVGTMDVAAKMNTFADGLARANGRQVTGLVKEVKEDKVATMHVYFTDLYITVKPNLGESVEPGSLEATAIYQECAVVLAT